MRALSIIFLLTIIFSCKEEYSYVTNAVIANSKKSLDRDLFGEFKQYGLHNKDTVVDIGAGSGYIESMVGCYFDSLHYYLVDIDSSILNKKNIDFTTKRHSKTCHRKIRFTYNIIINKEDTIPLQSNTYRKVISRLTLHELSQPEKFILEMYRIVRPHGELILIERVSQAKGELDVSCGKEYLTKQKIYSILNKIGLKVSNETQTPWPSGCILRIEKK